jgi:ParB-like chromosome segregation protein Spo0J
MPGYRTLSSHLLGAVAEIVREAEGHQRDGNLASAACLLEQGLEQATDEGGETPAWLCGRLASLYRSLQRYDDEVALLERYGESQASEESRARFRARLSKARAIAYRCRKADTGALRTVRDVQTRSKGRRRHSGAGQSSLPIAS